MLLLITLDSATECKKKSIKPVLLPLSWFSTLQAQRQLCPGITANACRSAVPSIAHCSPWITLHLHFTRGHYRTLLPPVHWKTFIWRRKNKRHLKRGSEVGYNITLTQWLFARRTLNHRSVHKSVLFSLTSQQKEQTYIWIISFH